MKGYYQMIEGHDGGFMFALRAGNHETILESRVFWTRPVALDALEQLRALAADAANYVRCCGADGSHWFELRDAEQRPLARSPGCATRAGLAAGIASVQRNAPSRVFRGLVRRSLHPG